MTKVGVDAIDTSTTLESDKSQTRLLGSDGWDGAIGDSYDARDGMTFFMHSSPGEDTLGHPFMTTIQAFK